MDGYGFGRLVLVVINSAVFVVFTLAMFPVLIVVYRRRAISEVAEVRAHFGVPWAAYAAAHPRFVPHRHPRPDRHRPDRHAKVG